MIRKKFLTLTILVLLVLTICAVKTVSDNAVRADFSPTAIPGVETGIIDRGQSFDSKEIYFKVSIDNSSGRTPVNISIFTPCGGDWVKKQIGKSYYYPKRGGVTTYTIPHPVDNATYVMTMGVGKDAYFKAIVNTKSKCVI